MKHNLDWASTLNPVWRKIAQRLVETCSRCGQPRLYAVFDAHIASAANTCLGCRTTYYVTRPLVCPIFQKTGLSDATVKVLMANPLLHKTMLSVVRSIHHFGVRTPQPTAVSVVIVWNYSNRYNLQCLHCHLNSGDADEEALSTDEAFQMIQRLGDGASPPSPSQAVSLSCGQTFTK